MKLPRSFNTIRARVLAALLLVGLAPIVLVWLVDGLLLRYAFHRPPLQGLGAAAYLPHHLLLLGVVTAVGGLIYAINRSLNRRLTRTLELATQTAQKVTAGQANLTLPDSELEEIHQLTGAVNVMLREVQQGRERLENLVELRTVRLRQSQQQMELLTAHLRAAYEAIQDGMLMLEWPSGRFITANRRFGTLFGITPGLFEEKGERELSYVLQNCFTPPNPGVLGWEHYRQRPSDTLLEEWTLTQPKRSALSVYSAPVAGAQGHIFARIWMFRDLTQQRELEEELRQSQKMDAVGRLAGGVAHDFNNLLTGILGNLSMAQLDLPAGRVAGEYVHSATQAAKRASELVQQLLSFSRRSTLRRRPCDVNTVLREVADLLRHTIDPQIEIVQTLQQPLWLTSADTNQLHQVITNLCVNARDAMPQGGRLELRSENVHVSREEASRWLNVQAGDYVRLTVRDTGTGMSAEVQSHLFEPFFTTKEQGKGTGLGLATSYGIVKQHGGTLLCESVLGQGTVFSIYLARTEEAAASAPATAPAAAHTPTGAERILLVDDETTVRLVTQAILQHCGYQVQVAADGEEALRLFALHHRQLDLVLLDLTMPKLSGRETFARLRQIDPRTAIVISSGYLTDLDAFEQEVGSRPDGFIPKPYDVSELARAVREILDHRRTAAAGG